MGSPRLVVGPAVGYSVDIQDDSWIVDITVGDYFLGVCAQKNSYQQGPYSYLLLSCVYFLILVNALQCSARATYRAHYNAMQPWTASKWNKQIPGLSLHFLVHYSEPSSEVCCSQGCDFWKPALSTGQCKLKAISWS